MLALTSVLFTVVSATTCISAVQAKDAACAAAHTCRNENEACRSLAIDAETVIESGKKVPKLEPTSSDVQPARPAAAAGSACVPSSATTSVETVGTGGACVQATGADQGTQTTTSITLNPLGLATLDDPKAFARTSRLTNLTLLVPVSTATSGKFPTFVGVRAAFDVAGIANGALAYKRITDAYNEALKQSGALVDQLLAALRQPGTKTPACIDAIAAPDVGAIETACNVPVLTQAQRIVQAREAVREQLAAVRQEVDNKHGGLLLDADIPLKNLDQPQVPLRMAGQVQGRIRGASAGWSAGLTGGLGASYVKPKGEGGATAFTWRLGVTADAGLAESDVHASVGFAGNAGKLLDETTVPSLNGATGHFTDLQALVTVPLTAGTGVTATVSWPISRDNARHGPTFSISFDGAYLLGSSGQKPTG